MNPFAIKETDSAVKVVGKLAAGSAVETAAAYAGAIAIFATIGLAVELKQKRAQKKAALAEN